MEHVIEPWPLRPGMLLLTVTDGEVVQKNVCRSRDHATACIPWLERAVVNYDREKLDMIMRAAQRQRT
jgi:hypothetical protein